MGWPSVSTRCAIAEKSSHVAPTLHISSSGIGSLIVSIGEYRDEDGDIIFHRITDDAMHVFEMLDLLDYVTRAD